MEVGRKVIFELIGRFLHTHVGIRGGQLNNFGVLNQLCFVSSLYLDIAGA